VWDEARVALFKQSLDTRIAGEVPWQQPARVSFGQGWVRDDAWELFAESVALFDPILPMKFDEDTAAVWRAGQLPQLKELCLHMGTSWPWHRPVYCPHGKGHVRIEFRALPAGPTSLDMVANAAFSMGLAMGMSKNIRHYIAAIPFRFAEYNFYRAAQSGLDARILWPFRHKHQSTEVSVLEVIQALFPLARAGLQQLQVAESDIDTYMGIIEKRVETGMTGARWQKNTHRHLEQQYGKSEASRRMCALYTANARSCVPVSEWEQIW